MTLAPYAVSKGVFTEREYPIEPHPFRNDFQRDRDRIVHSRAFRRLEYKTQVFVNHLGDNYRTRLTHSIEVAQLSRTVARTLRLNEDLCETIALAHDLGHPPFGHAGEQALHQLMQDHGGFDHNEQTLRVVTLLEERYPQHPGLNLMRITLLGLRKHGALPNGLSHSLEAQIVDYCDEIAYNNHDVDDGIAAGYLSLEQLNTLELWQQHWGDVIAHFPNASEVVKIRTVIRNLTNLMVTDLIENLRNNLQKFSITSIDEVLNFGKHHPTAALVGYSEKLKQPVVTLKKFLTKNLYNHPQVKKMNDDAQQVITNIFSKLLQKPSLLPPEYAARIDQEGLHRVIADFIAGMTDRYAWRWLTDNR